MLENIALRVLGPAPVLYSSESIDSDDFDDVDEMSEGNKGSSDKIIMTMHNSVLRTVSIQEKRGAPLY